MSGLRGIVAVCGVIVLVAVGTAVWLLTSGGVERTTHDRANLIPVSDLRGIRPDASVLLVYRGTTDAASLHTGAVCSGAAVGRVVITARHCLASNATLDVVVAPRDVCASRRDDRIPVRRFLPPPQGKERLDLAIGILDRPVGRSSDDPLAQIARLLRKVDGSGGNLATVGWGAFTDAGIHACTPHSVVLRPRDWTSCSTLLPDRYLPPRQEWAVCAAGVGDNTCTGDSGGPVLTRTGVQVAVTASGLDCEPGSPGVYALLEPFASQFAELGIALESATS